MSQYKYYFKKPKGAIMQDVLLWLAIGGAVTVAATSPYFIQNVLRAFQKGKQYPKKQVYNTFYRLRKEGHIVVQKTNHQISIALTDEGRKKAGRFQINSLQIKKPKKWDGKWRIVMFDVLELHRVKREALRGMLRELGLRPFQKSVWISPYDCRDEIELLKDFFGLTSKEVKFVVAENIGEDEGEFKKVFNLS